MLTSSCPLPPLRTQPARRIALQHPLGHSGQPQSTPPFRSVLPRSKPQCQAPCNALAVPTRLGSRCRPIRPVEGPLLKRPHQYGCRSPRRRLVARARQWRERCGDKRSLGEVSAVRLSRCDIVSFLKRLALSLLGPIIVGLQPFVGRGSPQARPTMIWCSRKDPRGRTRDWFSALIT